MDYASQIQLAIDYIEDNLGLEPTLADISAQAGFSMFHFSRLFHLVMGETVTAYVRERRLAHCAEELLSTDDRTLDIATRWGFASQATFSRAFKRTYGLTPATYRRGRTPLFIEKPRLSLGDIEHLNKGVETEPCIEDIPAFTVIGMRFVWNVSDGYRVSEWWEKFAPRIPEIQGADSCTLIGVCEYTPSDCFTVERPLQYIAGVPVPPGTPVPDGMVSKEIATSKYAVFRHTGGVETLLESCRFILGTWLPTSEYEAFPADNFEIYDPESLRGETEAGVVSVYLPVE